MNFHLFKLLQSVTKREFDPILVWISFSYRPMHVPNGTVDRFCDFMHLLFGKTCK